MTGFTEYQHHDAVGLAELLRRRQVSRREVIEAAIGRLEEVNPQLNAVINVLPDLAREIAGAQDHAPDDSPLAGVPFLLKDSGIQISGQRTSNGSRFWGTHPAPSDTTVARRYRKAGLVFLGFTNTAENGLASETNPAAYGPTHNPWDRTRSPGGSSGGAAVAVAAGIVPAAHATDGGGSIRIPSANNGLFGLKPTRGRSPFGPDLGEGWNGLSVHHVISRSVRDSAAFLDAIQGPEPGDPYAAPPRPDDFLSSLGTPPRHLRIALQTVGHDGRAVDPVVAEATRDVARLLIDLGHDVEEARPDIDTVALKRAMRTIVASNTANVLSQRGAQLGRPVHPDDVEPITWLWGQEGRIFTGEDLAWSIGAIHRLSRSLGRFFSQFDILLTPTFAVPPLPLGTIDMQSNDLDAYFGELFDYTIFTSIYNCTGVPAASVPLVWSEGLPIGVQIAAPFGADAQVLSLAAQLEAARPWTNRRPKIGGVTL